MSTEEYVVDGEVSRKRTTVEKEVAKHRNTAHELVITQLPPEPTNLHSVDPYIPQALCGAMFCGHLVTDLDSIAGAIGASELYGKMYDFYEI